MKRAPQPLTQSFQFMILTHMCPASAGIGAENNFGRCSSDAVHLSPETGSLTGLDHTKLAGWPVSLGGSPCLYLHSTGVTSVCYSTWLFHVDSGDPNSGPYARVTSAVAAMLSPQPYAVVSQKFRRIDHMCAQFPCTILLSPSKLFILCYVYVRVPERIRGVKRSERSEEVSDPLELELQTVVSGP